MPADPEAAALLEAAAAAVRAAYCAERNDWHRVTERRETTWGAGPVPADGGRDARGRARENVWAKVARAAIAAGVDPVALVRAQFRARSGKPPEPTQLAGPAAFAELALVEAQSRAELARLFLLQQDRLQAELNRLAPCQRSRGWTAADALRVVLGNALIPLSALFRYCAAEAAGLADLAAYYRPEAALQYLAAPADYGAVWRGFIPPSFVTAVTRLAEGVAALGGPVQDGTAVPAEARTAAYRRPVRD